MLRSYVRPTPTKFVHLCLAIVVAINLLIALLVVTTTSFVPYDLANVRNWQILLAAACLAHVLFYRQNIITYDAVAVSHKLFTLVGLSFLLSFIACGYLHYFSFRLNGMDFSIFDWMLYNTNHRAFMTAPVCGDCNHFGIHPSYVMLPLAYVHRLWTSPLLLQTTQAVAVWAAGLLVWRLARHYGLSDFWALLLVLAAWSNSWVGAILNLGFHIEVFYLPLGLALILAWLRGNWWQQLIAALLFLSIKEDAAIYLSSMMLGALIFERKRWREALALLLLAVMFGAFNILVAQPYFQSLSHDDAPQYLLRFWGAYGSSKGEIIGTMLTSPVRVFADVLTSRWYWLYGSALFIPLLAPRALLAALPILLLHGTATGDSNLRHYSMYYSAPLLPFLFWGLCEGLARLRAWRGLARERFTWLAVAAITTFTLTGGNYLRFPEPRPDILADMAAIRAKGELADKLVCAQTILHPHLPYAWNLSPLDDRCLTLSGSVVFMHPDLSQVPQSPDEYRSYVEQTRLLQSLPGGTQLRVSSSE